MRYYSLFLQIFIAGVILGVANLGVEKLAKTSTANQLRDHCEAVKNPTDIFLGNSLAAAGIDEEVFNLQNPKRCALNAGCGSTGPLEHYLIFEKTTASKGGTIYYCFFDTQLTDERKADWDTLTGNSALAYYFNLQKTLELSAPHDPVKMLRLTLVSYFPIFYERLAIWAKIEKLRRKLTAIGVPVQEENRFGRITDFELLEPENLETFAVLLGNQVKEKVGLNIAVSHLVKRLRELECRLVFVLMPMPKLHRTRFNESKNWQSYLEHIKEIARANGAGFVSAIDWVEDSGFADHLHLNSVGAKRFSQKIYLESDHVFPRK